VSSAKSTSSPSRRSKKATSSRSSTSRNASPHIRFEPRGAVGLLIIDRQERRNALNGELCDAMRAQLRENPDLRAVVITGAGSAFCSGADLVTRFDDGDGTDTFRPAFEKVLDEIVAYPAPVIAAINGPAMGAGMQLAVACDLRVAALGARLAIPGGRLGIHLSGRNIWRLASLVGHAVARDFLLAGRTVNAEEALHLGLVQRCAEDAVGDALSIAGEIAAYAPLTVQGHKRSLNLVAEQLWLNKRARDEIERLEARAFASDDLREGLAAFAEKRNPNFRGE
jgi:enoyl-CoA hydratase